MTEEYRQRISLLAAQATAFARAATNSLIDQKPQKDDDQSLEKGRCVRVDVKKSRSNHFQTNNHHLISFLPSQLVARHMMRNDHPSLVPFHVIQDVLFSNANKKEEEIKTDQPSTGSDDNDSNYYLACCKNCGAALQPGWNGTTLRLESSVSTSSSSSCFGSISPSSSSAALTNSKIIPKHLTKVQRRRLARKRHTARKQCQKRLLLQQQQRKQQPGSAGTTSSHQPHNIVPPHGCFPMGPSSVKLRFFYKNWLVLTCGSCAAPTVVPGAIVTPTRRNSNTPAETTASTKNMTKQALLPGKRALASTRSDEAKADRKQSPNNNNNSGTLSSSLLASSTETMSQQSQQLGEDFISLPMTTKARPAVQGKRTSSSREGEKRSFFPPAKARGTLQVPTERQTLHHLAANKKKKRKPDQLMSFLSSLNDP